MHSSVSVFLWLCTGRMRRMGGAMCREGRRMQVCACAYGLHECAWFLMACVCVQACLLCAPTCAWHAACCACSCFGVKARLLMHHLLSCSRQSTPQVAIIHVHMPAGRQPSTTERGQRAHHWGGPSWRGNGCRDCQGHARCVRTPHASEVWVVLFVCARGSMRLSVPGRR